ncbi:hypothetical protein FGO68_gene4855 [Halteria grandinella]|uniref:Uncharacterized protein n=1 Tax=Halteria grandinella TaxID=5974 RepID=A0A8J8P0D5_HALGN|nr:hypothetical protein FGO68_gene4855 [Halteria grandinella]
MVELLTCRHLANLELKHALRHAHLDAFNFHSHYIQSFGLADAYTYFLLVLSHYRFPTSHTYLSHYLSLLSAEHSLQTLRHGDIPLDIPAFKGYLKKNMTSERIGLLKVNTHAFSRSMREADQELFSGQRIEMKPSYRAQQRYMVNPAVFRKQDNGGGMREAMREEYLEEIRKEYQNREDRHRVGL